MLKEPQNYSFFILLCFVDHLAFYPLSSTDYNRSNEEIQGRRAVVVTRGLDCGWMMDKCGWTVPHEAEQRAREMSDINWWVALRFTHPTSYMRR